MLLFCILAFLKTDNEKIFLLETNGTKKKKKTTKTSGTFIGAFAGFGGRISNKRTRLTMKILIGMTYC